MKRLNSVLCTIATLFASLPSAPLLADQRSANPPEEVTIPLNPLPFDLRGYLRRPDGNGPFPAVIILAACGRFVSSVDHDWGEAISSWGYVTLTLDVFTPRRTVGRKTCLYPAPPELAEDAYRGLNLLIKQKSVNPKRIFIVGFGRGGSLAFSAVERDGIERYASQKFRGAIAFYPSCSDVKGVMTVTTLVVVGERDKKTLDACRRMVEGEDDIGISRQHGAGAPIQLATLPDAYFGFDLPAFQKPIDVRGFHIEFSKPATDQSREMLRQFLQSHGR